MKVYEDNERKMVIVVSTTIEENFCLKQCPKHTGGKLRGQDVDTGKDIEIEIDLEEMEQCPCARVQVIAFVQSKETMEVLKEAGRWQEILDYVESQ